VYAVTCIHILYFDNWCA